MRRSIIALVGAATLLLAALVPAAAAASSTSFAWEDAYDVDHSCAIVEHVTLSVEGRAYFDNDGTWLRDLVHFHYGVTYENTETGESLVTRTTQSAQITPDTVTLRAQGYFIRGGAGLGLVHQDVGRLVFDVTDGSTMFATPGVVRVDDPAGADAVDAALCEALG